MADDLQLPPLGPEPTVTVVVPARDAAETLHRAVSSALVQETEGELEVVLAVPRVDDKTSGVADRLATNHANVRVVDNPAGTTPAGLNAAIEASDGQVVVRLDAHAELPQGYVQRAIELLRESGAANVGGRQVPEADEGFAAAVADAMTSPVGSGAARYRVGGPAGEVDTVYLGVFRREALEAVGGFDEQFVRNQDYELNHRLREAGGTVYFHPDLAVRYRPRATVGDLWKQYFEYGAWRRRTMRTHRSSWRLRQLAAPTLVLTLLITAVIAVLGYPWLFVGILAAELATVLIGAAGTSPPTSRRFLGTALALLVMHLAWGSGLLVGRAQSPEPGGGTPEG